MVDITHKQNSLRRAIATATIQVSKQETIDAVNNNTVPKGNVFEFSRAAGLLAIKNTYAVIPDCHPLPVEFASIRHEVNELQIIITVEVATIYKTGVEVEAMHGASITALTMYDMLKPLDKKVEIHSIRLQEKTGGKSDLSKNGFEYLNAAVVVCSDSISAGKKKDSSGLKIVEKLAGYGVACKSYAIISDEPDEIKAKALEYSSSAYHLVIFSGGTGVSPRDNTPETLRPLFTLEIPGIMETARNYGQQRTAYAMFSRGVAGIINKTLFISLPGSTKAVTESMDALFPQVFHLFGVMDGARHD